VPPLQICRIYGHLSTCDAFNSVLREGIRKIFKAKVTIAEMFSVALWNLWGVSDFMISSVPLKVERFRTHRA
jgi:hypothetical protein|tara:strand:+ start:7528 stop:7743 length:216 start_codon:yes stop_codon:yes gene_type:complete